MHSGLSFPHQKARSKVFWQHHLPSTFGDQSGDNGELPNPTFWKATLILFSIFPSALPREWAELCLRESSWEMPG
jgi:hypothetical protein